MKTIAYSMVVLKSLTLRIAKYKNNGVLSLLHHSNAYSRAPNNSGDPNNSGGWTNRQK